MQKLETWVVSFTHWVIQWRWIVILGALGFALAAGSGGRFLSFGTDYRIFFSKANPQLNAFEEVQNIYTKNDNVLFVIEPKDGKVFAPATLQVVEELTAEGWKVPYSIRVDAVTNFQHTRADGDDIIVADLVENAASKSSIQLVKAKKIALAEPTLLNIAISPDAHVTGVNVTVQLPGKSILEVPKIVAHARDLAKKLEEKYPDIKIYLTGMVMLNNAFSEAAQNDMATLVPIMYLGMILLMFITIRSICGVITSLVVIAFSTITAMGIAGWFGVQLTPPSAQAPTMIMTLAIADSIHILVTLLREMRMGMPKREAIVESMRINFTPIFVTSLTTVIGFLSMNFSDSPPFRHLGNITAVGMSAAFLYSIFLLPALMSILPLHVKKEEVHKASNFRKVADFVIARRRPILWTTSFAVLILGFFITKNSLNDQFVDYFDKRIPFRTDTDFIMENLTGIYHVEHSIDSGESSGISNPKYLAKLEDFSDWYRQQPGVLQVNSFSHVMKRLNKSMHFDREDYFKIPGSQELAAQYLLLYEFSLPYGLDLNNQINIDKSATRFTATIGNLTTNEIQRIANDAEDWLRKNVPEEMFAYGVSPAVMFAHISERNIKGMLTGTTLAIILISACLIFAFRSLKFGFLSLIPNLVPAVMAFGIWGLIVSEVGVAVSIVSGMTIGIVVDDTIHFMSKYLRGRREQGLTSQDSVRYAFESVGRPIVFTSIILICGFMILSASSFKLNGTMGQLTAIVILIALVMDLTMLPSLLMQVDGAGKTADSEKKEKEEGIPGNEALTPAV